jgi:hypothetical protein
MKIFSLSGKGQLIESKLEFMDLTSPNLASILAEFVKLYAVCENKELLDRLLEYVVCRGIVTNNTNKKS